MKAGKGVTEVIDGKSYNGNDELPKGHILGSGVKGIRDSIAAARENATFEAIEEEEEVIEEEVIEE